MAATAALHLAVYAAVNACNVRRRPTSYSIPRLPLDDRIPYLPATAPFYYGADLYILLGGAWIVGRLEATGFRRAIAAYVGMIVLGGAVQVLFPIPGPWPEDLSPLQRFFHGLPGVERYAALPSMHVALAALPAGIAWSTRGGHTGALHLAAVAAIGLSTLTTKEHWVADVVAGAALGVAAWVWWRRGPRRGPTLPGVVRPPRVR